MNLFWKYRYTRHTLGANISISQTKFYTAYDERTYTIAYDAGCHHP